MPQANILKLSIFSAVLLFSFLLFPAISYGADRYWVGAGTGATANWNTTASWSTTSGGASGASVPGASDAAIFDGGNSMVGGVTVDATVSVVSITITSGYTGGGANDGEINTGAYTITTSGALAMAAGKITRASGSLTITANSINNTAGSITTTTSGNVTINSTGTVGSFTLYTVTSAGIINIGNTAAPSAVTINSTVSSADTISIYSNSDITQNAAITSNSGANYVYFYPDADNSGTATFTKTSGTITATGTSFYFPSSATTAFTLAGIDASAGTTNVIDVGVATATSPASVSITGVVTSNSNIIIRSLGNITQNAHIDANSGATGVYFYPDIDNSGTATFTRTSGTITADSTYFYFPLSATTAFTLAGVDASLGTTNFVVIGSATLAPASVNITGAIVSNSEVQIQSMGNITQNADITANSGASNVYFYPDRDNSGTATFTRTSGTITAGSTYFDFPASATTAFTLAGLDASAGTTNDITVGYATATSPASVSITGAVTSNSVITIRSLGNITQNADITANSGNSNVVIYPDVDNSGTATFTRTSGTITATTTYFYFPASATTAFTLAGLDASTGTTNAVNVGGAAATSPASVNITGTVTSNSSITMRSLGDITQNAHIDANSGTATVVFYPDIDNSGTATFTRTSGTITASGTYFYFPASSITAFTLAGLDASGGTANRIYLSETAATAPASINITGAVIGDDYIYVRSLGNITQNADITANSGASGISLYPDVDNTGTATFTRTSGIITATNTYFYFPASSTTAFTLAGLDSSLGTTNVIDIGATTATSPSSVSITGEVTSNSTITVRSLGDINQGASLNANSGSSAISMLPNLSVGSSKVYISDNSVLTSSTYTVTGDLTINSGKTLDANGSTISITGNTALSGGTLKTGTNTITFGDAAGDTVTISSGELQIQSDNTSTDIVKNAGTWTNSGGTITYNAATVISVSLLSSLSPYYNLTVNSTGSTYTANGAIDADAALTLTAGTFALGANTLNVGGNLSIANGSTFTKATGGQAFTFDGTGSLTDSNTTKQDLGAVTVDGTATTRTLGAAVKMTSLTVGTDDTFSLAGYNFDFSAAAAVVNNGIFQLQGGETLTNVNNLDTDTGTVKYAGAAGSSTFSIKDFGTTDYYNLTINGAATETFQVQNTYTLTIAGALTATQGKIDFNGQSITTTGNLTIGASSQIISDVDAMNGADINVGGNLDLDGELGDKLTFNWTAAWSLDVTGTADIDYVSFQTTAANAMTLVVLTGTATASNVDVEYSNATGSANQIDATDGTNTNNSNNTYWSFSAAAVFDQKHFKIYQDDAGLNSATQYNIEDANYNVPISTNFRIRFEVANTGGIAANITRRLEFKEGSGSWTQITADSNNIRLQDSTNFTDAGATTTRLTATGTFTAGQGKDTGSDTSQISLTNAYYTEDEYSLRFQTGASGNTYQLRITNAGVALDTYSQTPSITPGAVATTVFKIKGAFKTKGGLKIK